MKYLLGLLILISFQTFSQTKAIEITDAKGKIVFIKQDKRIKIVTNDGKKYFGHVNIIDNEHVVIRKDTIALTNISKIQKRSAAKSALSAVIIVASCIAIPASAAIILSDLAAAGALFGTGMIGLPTGILLPVLGKTYKRTKYTFKIVYQ